MDVILIGWSIMGIVVGAFGLFFAERERSGRYWPSGKRRKF